MIATKDANVVIIETELLYEIGRNGQMTMYLLIWTASVIVDTYLQ